MIFIVTYVAYPKRLGLRFVIGEYSVRLPGIRARRTIRIISSDDFLIYIFFPTQFKRPNVKITHPVRTVVYCSAAVTRNDDVLCYVSYAFRRACFYIIEQLSLSSLSMAPCTVVRLFVRRRGGFAQTCTYMFVPVDGAAWPGKHFLDRSIR